MNETAARNVILVRAYESVNAGNAAWSDADRTWASRAAAEVVGSDSGSDRYLARRAALAVERLGERDRAVRKTLKAVTWRPWVGWALVLIAFVLGFATDAIGPAQRVNVLAFPLLGLLVWNLAVYVFIVPRGVIGLVSPSARAPGPIRRLVDRLAHGAAAGTVRAKGDAPLAAFARDWSATSAPLMGARAARCLHLSAFAFALGALAALYLRGVVFEYRAGWGSTFLDSARVHQLLSFVLGPASNLTGIPIPDAQQLASIRFSEGPGENAAPWIHLYATILALAILLPRALLALWAWITERRLERRFPVALDDAYFQRLLRGFRNEAARIRVVPYSFQLAPQAALGLNALMTRVFGPNADVAITPSIAFGGEDTLPADIVPAQPHALIAPLFSLAATPEPENHGAFIAALGARGGRGAHLVVLLDESGFRKRFAAEPARLDERREAWRRMLATQSVEPVFLDLIEPDLSDAEKQLSIALDRFARTESTA